MQTIYMDKIWKETESLYNEGIVLLDALERDYDTDPNDFSKIIRFTDRLNNFRYLTLVYYDMVIITSSITNEKERFEIQKIANNHFNHFTSEIESYINICNTWKLRDYRCQNYQKKLGDFFTDLKKQFSEAAYIE